MSAIVIKPDGGADDARFGHEFFCVPFLDFSDVFKGFFAAALGQQDARKSQKTKDSNSY
jgi:hypothetical protein